MQLSTQSLKVFLNVIEQGSFSKAARVLFMSQPSVSVQVRDLESLLGVHLVHRSPTGIAPTPAGEALAAKAREVQTILSDIEYDLAEVQGAAEQRLNVGVTGTLGHSLIPKVLANFEQTHPGLGVELRVGNAYQVVQWVLDRKVGIGVCAGRLDEPRLRTWRILDERLTLLAAADHPLAIQQANGNPVTTEQLCKERFLLRESGSATRADQDLSLAMWGCVRTRTWTVWSVEAALECVRAGTGLSLISEHVAARDLELGAVVSLNVQRLPPRRPVTVCQSIAVDPKPIEKDLITALIQTKDWSA